MAGLSNKQILEQAIQKAINGGWTGYWYGVLKTEDTMPSATELYQLIFNHDFAKALWGDTPEHQIARTKSGSVRDIAMSGYKYHLQRMVVAEDPIQYLADNI